MEIGEIVFFVPNVVITELVNLTKDPSKRIDATDALQYIKKFKKIPITGTYADKEILQYVSTHVGAVIATVDTKLKQKVKEYNRSVITLSNNNIVLES